MEGTRENKNCKIILLQSVFSVMHCNALYVFIYANMDLKHTVKLIINCLKNLIFFSYQLENW